MSEYEYYQLLKEAWDNALRRKQILECFGYPTYRMVIRWAFFNRKWDTVIIDTDYIINHLKELEKEYDKETK